MTFSFLRVLPNMADRCRIVIEAVLKYAQELLSSDTNLSLPADLKVSKSFTSIVIVFNPFPAITILIIHTKLISYRINN